MVRDAFEYEVLRNRSARFRCQVRGLSYRIANAAIHKTLCFLLYAKTIFRDVRVCRSLYHPRLQQGQTSLGPLASCGGGCSGCALGLLRKKRRDRPLRFLGSSCCCCGCETVFFFACVGSSSRRSSAVSAMRASKSMVVGADPIDLLRVTFRLGLLAEGWGSLGGLLAFDEDGF